MSQTPKHPAFKDSVISKETAQPGTPPKSARGRPKDPEKRKAIFAAARKIFREKGYINTSMQEIADAAGVSKLTLYSHFEDKDDLFRMALEELGQAIRFDQDLVSIAEKSDPHTTLMHVARFVMITLTSPESLASQRMVLAEARHFPHVSRAYIFAGLDGFLVRLEDGLNTIARRYPEYHFPNPKRAASMLYGMVKGDLQPRFLYDVNPPSVDIVEAYLNDCVAFFLAAHRRPTV